MKKLFSIALLLIMLLSACSAPPPQPPAAVPAVETDSTESEPVAETGQPVEIVWYVRSKDVEQKWQNETVIPAFEKLHPNIKINLVVVTWEEFDTKMQAMIAAGTPPDIWSHWGPSGFQDYVKRGLVADLTPYIEKNKFDISDFEPSVLDIYKVDGKVMGLPMLTTGSFLFYNKDMFDKAGLPYPPTNWDDTSWTYDKFLETCKALTNDTGDPATSTWGCELSFWPNDAYAWMWGQDLYPDEAYQTGFADKTFMNTQPVIDAFQAKQDLVWKYKYQPDPAATEALQGLGDLLEAQKVAMRGTGGWGWWRYPAVKDFRWGAAAVPYGAPGRKVPVFTDPWMMSSKSNHPEEAFTFLSFLASAEQQRIFMELTGAPPARKSLADSWYQQFPDMTPEEVKEVHLGALKYGRESPNHLLVKFDQLDQIVGSAVDPISNNDQLAADAIPAAAAQLEAALQQIKAEFEQ